MIKYGNIDYKLCLLDTNAISEILKNRQNERVNFFERFVAKNHIPCVTIWSILELRKSHDLYDSFLQIFSHFPFCLLKPYYKLLDEEIENYFSNDEIDPILYVFNPLQDRIEAIFQDLFNKNEIKNSENSWRLEWPHEVLDSIQKLKKNFEPKGKFFNGNDSIRFVKEGVPQYLFAQKAQWANELVLVKKEKMNIDAFKSVKFIFFTVFHRFYAEKREPELGDVFDLMISCILPYLDSTIIENFQAEIIKKVQRKDNFLSRLETYTLKDLK